ncbi:MAG: ATP-binding cassette domain-containing protein [Alphaproteobacteria bacterium]|nr:ATP-binding cassette domain-containing protein [Alphaproteobacteria bacterium]
MAPPLLTLQDIRLAIGTTPLLDGAELFVDEGARLCIVGRNGSGKSTLLKIAAGLTEADGGRRFIQPDATIRYLPQEPDLSGYANTHAYVEAGLAPGDDPARAYYLLGQLGLTGAEQIAQLSGGQARRAALARVLAPKPDILLLDEPTNHLDLPAILWLERELSQMKGALVLISHDRRFLQNLSRATVWLDRGRTYRLGQGFAAYEAWRDQLLEEEERERHKQDRKIAAEEHWVRYGVTARRKRNVRRMAELADLRRTRREARQQMGQVKMTVTEAGGAGTRVIEAKNITKVYDDKPIVTDFSVRVLRGDRIGVVGPNGAGKTTLVNLLAGRLKPDAGEVVLGTNLSLATLDQSRALLDSEKTLASVLTGGVGDKVEVGGQSRHVVSYMKDFLFTPEQAQTPVHVLSGGERARLLLAKALAKPANLLVLDEPTNDLDLETLDLLEEMIDDYPGTVLLVSHDRDFLDRTVTAVLTAEGGGLFTEYAGGYSDMAAQREEGMGLQVSAKEDGKPAAKERKRAAAPRQKLTFSDKHALETLPAKITALEKTIAGLHTDLSDGTLYMRDPDKARDLSDKLAAAERERAVCEDRWLELELLREEIEGSSRR